MVLRTLTSLAAVAFITASIPNAFAQKSVRKFVSGWSQNIETSMVFLKLDAPSLLETARMNDSQELVIDPNHLRALIAEQDALEKELVSLSPQIQILYRYRFVMNGITIAAPAELYETILNLRPVKALMEPTYFNRPIPLESEVLEANIKRDLERITTTDFIGATRAHNELNLKGQGIHVGIIDSGIDYTHAMFGGPGTQDVFQSIAPHQASEYFPNQKVVGGYDFVGDSYNPGSILSDIRIPRPDVNPIDTSGHGTHVAGTVAGVGYDQQSYNGVAPEARLHALKVFGPQGGTSDLVVMAAMEYAVDPNGDLDPKDRLDVINLSLGGIFGKGTNNYQEAVKNLSKAGVLVTASAGNSGAIPYVVGSPSTADAAFSIGASIDGMFHNWRFDAVEFRQGDQEGELIEAVEGPITLPVAMAEDVRGPLVDAGLGNAPFSDELRARVQGKVALLERGGEAFATKITNALDAGAIAVVMVNNQPGNPIPMGGDGQFPIPGVMVSMEYGQGIKAKLAAGEEVIADFDPGRFIQQPELVDTLASFSSQGPRSEDGRLKPEIVAPGYQIFSAAAGSGNRVVPMNGTSMSAPQMAGVMALLRQAHPQLSVEELQTLAMNTARNMVDPEGKRYELSRQGAGRVQVYEALTAKLMAAPRAFSLGEQRLEAAPTVIERQLKITALDREGVESIVLAVEATRNMQVVLPQGPISLNSQSTLQLPVSFVLTQADAQDEEQVLNHEAVIQVKDADTGAILARVPALAVGLRAARVQGELAGDRLQLSNDAAFPGIVWPMNLLARGLPRPFLVRDRESVSTACHLKAAGYRIKPASLTSGPSQLQFGFEIDQPVSRWEACTVIVLFSVRGGSGDYKEADLELVGSSAFRLSDLGEFEITSLYNSLLFDASRSRTLRGQYEAAILQLGSDQGVPRPDYSQAILDAQLMATREHGRAALITTNLAPLMRELKARGHEGDEVFVKVGILNNTNAAYKYDSFLSEEWQTLSLNPSAQAFSNLPQQIIVPAEGAQEVQLAPTSQAGELLLLMPDNL